MRTDTARVPTSHLGGTVRVQTHTGQELRTDPQTGHLYQHTGGQEPILIQEQQDTTFQPPDEDDEDESAEDDIPETDDKDNDDTQDITGDPMFTNHKDRIRSSKRQRKQTTTFSSKDMENEAVELSLCEFGT